MNVTLKYSVIVPVYNSAATLRELVNRLASQFKELNQSFELVFVNDYSSDDSWNVLKSIKDQNPELSIILISLGRNYGQHNATLCAMNHVSGEYVITLDDDLQNPPEELPKLIDAMNEADLDVVYGIGNASQSAYRRAGSKIWKKSSTVFDDGMGEGSSFRLIKRELVNKLINHKQEFIYLEEIIYWYTHHIGFELVKYEERKAGRSTYSPKRLFNLVFNLTMFYGSWPLKLMTFFGIAGSTFSFFLAAFYLVKKVVFGIGLPGFTSIIVSILFATSIILLCFGILGQYLRKIYAVLNNKPTFSIKSIIR